MEPEIWWSEYDWDQDFEQHDMMYEDVRGSPFALTQNEYLKMFGGHDYTVASWANPPDWDPEYWRSAYDEAMTGVPQ